MNTKLTKLLVDNASDIGLVSGILKGIELTAELTPLHKAAIKHAKEAVERIHQRNKELFK